MTNNLSNKGFLKKIKDKINQRIKNHGLFPCILFVLKKSPAVLMVLFIYMGVRLIRPFLFIRFGSLYAHKIGPLISRPGLYLCEKDNDIQPQNTLDIFHDGYTEDRLVCNHQLLNMYKRIFLSRKGVLLSNGIVKTFFDLATRNGFAEDHIIKTTNHSRDKFGLIEKSEIYLKFTDKEISQAESDIRKMGIPQGAPYVCMINRDQEYLKKMFPKKNWDYHSFRNCSIQIYMPAAEELTKKGYSVIRMGMVVGDLMDTDNPDIIEYAHRGFRTELLDIYLSAHCDFFISSGSGFDAIPWFFKRPEVYINMPQLEWLVSWSPRCLIIFRKYWLKKEKRIMTVREMIESGVGKFEHAEKHESMGIELIENTPEEIWDVVDEMDQRLKGTWATREEDEALQESFWSHLKSSDLHGVIYSRIGAKFLRENKEVLGLSSRAASNNSLV